MGASLLLNIFCLSRGIQVKEVSIMESLSYLFVPLFSWLLFKERITWRKASAIAVIMVGVIVFFRKVMYAVFNSSFERMIDFTF